MGGYHNGGSEQGVFSADEVVVFPSVGRELQRAGTDVLWTGAADGRLVISQCSVVTCSIELARVGGLWFRSLLNFHGTVRKSQASISYAHEYGCEPQTDID